MKVGIDSIAIYTSRYSLDLQILAQARHIDPNKYYVGLGQHAMSVPPPGEDIVTMAANAAAQVIKDVDINQIEMLLFATESGIDHSKAAGIYVHELLNLPPRCRVVELKQACYAGTAALQLALPFLQQNKNAKILLITSDVARYGLNTPGESSQGAAAVAMLLSANPRVIAFESEFGVVTENVMDFWRPNYLTEALVEGKYSSKLYISMLEKTWDQYSYLSGRKYEDHDYFCYHIPVPKLVEKSHASFLKWNGQDHLSEDEKNQQIKHSLHYGRQIGNSYTASLYLGLASLLDLTSEDLSNKRIGFYSYGSGCVAEYFSGIVQPHYQKSLHTDYHAALFTSRHALTYEAYEDFYTYHYPTDGSELIISPYETGNFRLTNLNQHKRIYERIYSKAIDSHDEWNACVNSV